MHKMKAKNCTHEKKDKKIKEKTSHLIKTSIVNIS